LGKKIKDSERPAEFARIRDIVFANAKISYDSNNLIHYESYRKALNRFGLVDDFLMIKYPETILKYDLSKEDDITSLMGEVASEYSDVIQRNQRDPAGLRADLWQLFRPDYNPKFEGFAEEQLEPIEMTLNQLDKIIKTEDDEEEESRGKAKGTSLEGTFGNPVDLAMTLRKIIDLRYIKSFGYSLEANNDDLSKQDIFAYVQMNLTSDAPFKESEESSKKEEASTGTSASPLNTTEPVKSGEKGTISSINASEEKKETVVEQSAINPVERTGSDKTTEISGGAPSTSSTPAEVTAETKAPMPAAGENILNVQMEPTPVTVTPPEASATTINQTNVATPAASPEAATSTSSSEKILKTESEKSTVNETKVKKGGFSKFLKNITESKIGQSLNLPGLVETAKDFAKVTKSEVLGGLPDFQKVKTGPNLINQVKESSKESVQAFNESTKTQKALEVVNQAKEMVSNKEKEQILEKSPQTTTATTKTETIEKAAPAVTPATVSNTTNVTQNQAGAQTTTNTASQTTQEGSMTSQNVQNAAQSTTYQPAQMTTDLPQTQVGGQPAAFNTSEMEERLRRIEHVLMDGLEVTIKQY
jgi:hypothetical protein